MLAFVLALVWNGPLPESPQSPALPSLAPLTEKLKPLVVSIQTTQAAGGDDDEGPDFFHRFFGGPEERSERRRSLGSGFIISADGHCITNYHVVKGATDVTIKLDDGREFKADVIGRDSKTDVALLRMRKAPRNLPIARLGDSDKLRVGDWIIAIGNPFGLGHTVTAGIVSAKERFFGAGPYDDFIQTDASINPGNSGGPLFNAQGEVVGVSAAIIQGGQGIGFAIPINIVKRVVQQLEAKGAVTRGWIGVDIQEMTPDLAQAFKLERSDGALIAQVERGGPASKAGIEPGDVIVSWGGKPVREANRLPLLVAETVPGNKVNVDVMRKGQKRSAQVLVGTLHEANDERENVVGREAAVVPPSDRRHGGRLGIQAHDLTPEVARRLGISGVKTGVLVLGVAPGGAAEGVLDSGDVIVEADGRTVTTTGALSAMVDQKKSGDVVLLRVRRSKQLVFAAVRLH
jgi:serine protease Do